MELCLHLTNDIRTRGTFDEVLVLTSSSSRWILLLALVLFMEEIFKAKLIIPFEELLEASQHVWGGGGGHLLGLKQVSGTKSLKLNYKSAL